MFCERDKRYGCDIFTEEGLVIKAKKQEVGIDERAGTAARY